MTNVRGVPERRGTSEGVTMRGQISEAGCEHAHAMDLSRPTRAPRVGASYTHAQSRNHASSNGKGSPESVEVPMPSPAQKSGYSQDPSAPLVTPNGSLQWVNDDLSTHSSPLVPTEPASVQISMVNVRAHGFHGLSQLSCSPPLPPLPAGEPTPEPRYHLRPRKAPASPACVGRRLAPRRNICRRREVKSSLARDKGQQIVKSPVDALE
ncbi:hypothetical protein B0H14DRAFT_3486170 [Mycena olivaceomarginata]|nr:hypothetical protein B0H14DRAFT_3486170 [Mycena olivaceomarginata]